MVQSAIRWWALVVASGVALACSGRSERHGSGSENGGTAGSRSGEGGSGTARGGVGAGGDSNGGDPTGGQSNGGGPAGGVAGTAGATAGLGGSSGADPTGGMAGVAAQPPFTTCAGEFPFVGRWSGSVQDFYFEPIDSLLLEVLEDEEGGLSGRLTWGEGEPPPPSTDPDQPPPGFESGQGGASFAPPWPGFPYTVQRGAACDGTFRFDIASTEIFEAWCSLQTPRYTENYGWSCTLQGGGSIDQETCEIQTASGERETYPAFKCQACAFREPICACDEHSCRASSAATHTFNLMWLEAPDGEVLSGPAPDCPNCTVRLVRDAGE